MKHLMVLVVAVIFMGCLKSNSYKPCTPVNSKAEEPQLVSFCTSHNIAYTQDTNGIFYQIIDPGTGVTPTLDSKISVIYTSTFINDSLFEEHTTVPVIDYLYNFIEGWRLAIPYIQDGGHIKMIIPSSLCFGCSGYPEVVPPNAPLFFDLVLVNVE